MINVKLTVLFICFTTAISCPNYCEICSQHTLCKYDMPGPSPFCKQYDESGRLSEDDINEIINRLNERRNFVAMGYSKHLPQAANMRKIVWSEELAVFAQRWVDQCDQSVRPDKEDDCRDLKHTKVGQNIATISGASPGFSVKSFVDIWFMQTLEFFGSVSYYNQSRDHKTRYFTQLIWADTGMVGCGKARFFVNHKNSIVERLVCNFSPKGNIHGKPIYAIGYPATQCPDNLAPDAKFQGLCGSNAKENLGKYTSSSPRVSSLLRILNLSNSSVKQDIDPIRNNLKQMKSNVNKTIEQRNPRTRHVLNNTYNLFGGRESGQNMHPMHLQNFWNQPKNVTTNYGIHPYQQERRHSRVYHGHDIHKNEQTFTNREYSEQNYRKYDFTTESMTTQDLPKYNRMQQCTRRNKPYQTISVTSCAIVNKCTRGDKHDCAKITQDCKQSGFTSYSHIYPHELCPCNTPQLTCSTATTRCTCNMNCQCLSNNFPTTTICQNNPRNVDITQDILRHDTKKSFEFQYYDLPNIGVRSGDSDNEKISPTLKMYTARMDNWDYRDNNPNTAKRTTKINTRKKSQERDVNRNINHKKSFDDIRNYSYGALEFKKRRKRDLLDQMTLKPFWQVDEYTQKKPPHLKAIKYTTISYKNKMTRKISTTVKVPTSTETITIKIKDVSNNNKKIVTEKYLSFDELMRLRKLGVSDIDTNARRKANKLALRENDPNTTTISTTEYTANTPFVRKKHCTRKLTCTWTVPSPTGADGSILGVLDHGSRTPPGYVDGCTRTSTCTRDFMNRNKLATLGEESSGEPIPEDEDYCERRSLNVHRRNADREKMKIHDLSYSKSYQERIFSPYVTDASYSLDKPTECICKGKSSRKKRDGGNDQIITRIQGMKNNSNERKLSYGDIYYLVLHRIMHTWQNNRSTNIHKCACNIGVLYRNCIFLVIFTIICNVTFRLFML